MVCTSWEGNCQVLRRRLDKCMSLARPREHQQALEQYGKQLYCEPFLYSFQSSPVPFASSLSSFSIFPNLLKADRSFDIRLMDPVGLSVTFLFSMVRPRLEDCCFSPPCRSRDAEPRAFGELGLTASINALDTDARLNRAPFLPRCSLELRDGSGGVWAGG